MDSDFEVLVEQLRTAGITTDPAYLHGLLAGSATIEESEVDKLCGEILGARTSQLDLREALIDLLEFLSEDLSLNDFHAELDDARAGQPERWIQGYLKSVELHGAEWQEIKVHHPRVLTRLEKLEQILAEVQQRRVVFERLETDELEEIRESVNWIAITIYQGLYGDIDDRDYSEAELPALPSFAPEALQAMDAQALFAILSEHEDRVPMEVIEACAGRGEAMVPLLHARLNDAANWRAEVSSGDWWALLHAVFILGLIPGKASAQALLDAFRKINIEHPGVMEDWFSGYWPALCRNKSEHLLEPMRQLAEDGSLDWYPRTHAVECLLAQAAAQSRAALDKEIDWLAARCASPAEDIEFRITAAGRLLDLPRPRHRKLLEALVVLQNTEERWYSNSFKEDDIADSFRKGDDPEWNRFDNPWDFYDPEQIEQRQRRWIEEDERDIEREIAQQNSWIPTKTFVRAEVKVGRNDPCPCGSGKKYKKCCLN